MEVVKLVFYALIALFILVTFHEFGHYWVARRCGVRVLKFSIGFGPVLLRKKVGETEFALSAIPLGGFVKMFGEGVSGEDTEEPLGPEEQKHSFSHKTVWQRMAIVVAGPVANFILAVFFYFFVFLGGQEGRVPLLGEVEPGSIADRAGLQEGIEILSIDGSATSTRSEVYESLLARIGDTGSINITWSHFGGNTEHESSLIINRWLSDADMPDITGSLGFDFFYPKVDAVIEDVDSGTPAEKAGLMRGDAVREIDDVSVVDWEGMTNIIRAHPAVPLTVVVERGDAGDGALKTLILTPGVKTDDDGQEYGFAGVRVKAPVWDDAMKRDRSYGIASAFVAAADKTWTTSWLILGSLKKLLLGNVSTKSLGGPITIAKAAGSSAEAGWQSFFQFIAFLSVMLGVVNLLPIPVLDGGHLLFYVIEAMKGSPLSIAIQSVALRFGVAVVFGIMLLALYNDFTRL